jgi:hypothetical protein
VRPAGPRSHPPAKPERRDHARHRRPGARCSATHPGRHHRGRAPGRVRPLLRRQPGMACSFSGTGWAAPGEVRQGSPPGPVSEAPMAAMLAENGAWAWPILLACADARAPRRQALVPLARVSPLRLVTAAGTGTNAARRSRGPGRGPGVAGNPSAASAVSAVTRIIRAARAHAAPDRTCGKERVNGRSLISRCQRPGGLSYSWGACFPRKRCSRSR